MKFVIVFALLAFVAAAYAEDLLKLTDEQKQKVRAQAGECVKQEQTTEEKVQALRKGEFDTADEHVKCFAKCFQEKLGLFANGAPQEEVIKHTLGPLVGEEQIKTIMGKCNSVKGANECDTAFQLYKCYYTEKAAYI